MALMKSTFDTGRRKNVISVCVFAKFNRLLNKNLNLRFKISGFVKLFKIFLRTHFYVYFSCQSKKLLLLYDFFRKKEWI